MISIYTRTNKLYKKEFLKWFAKKIIRKYTGPDAVLDSLTRGLTELNIPHETNPTSPKYEIVHVLSGIEILKEMIAKKAQGKIKVLIAGPTLVKTPYDHDNIVQDKNIDALLFPSNWTKDFYSSLVPALSEKIKIWPAGVQIPKEISSKQKILVFKKNIPEEIYQKVLKTLDDKKLQYDIIVYGKYDRAEYHRKLASASLLVYLQLTESQGLALQEAWSYDVPTMVYQNTVWKDGEYEWSDDMISAPYLTKDSGIFFTTNTFEAELQNIINNTYTFKPRNYCIENLSDKVSAQKYLEIIKHYVK